MMEEEDDAVAASLQSWIGLINSLYGQHQLNHAFRKSLSDILAGRKNCLNNLLKVLVELMLKPLSSPDC